MSTYPSTFIPRLCGGTFYNLLLKAKYEGVSARDHYAGISDSVTEVAVLYNLIRISYSKFLNGRLGCLDRYSSYYKWCNKNSLSPTYLPFNEEKDNNVVQPFRKTMAVHYDIALSRTKSFIKKCLDVNLENKGLKLATSIINLIKEDSDLIGDKTFIYQGRSISASDLVSLDSYDLPALILAVWFYIVTQIKDNTIGSETVSNGYLTTLWNATHFVKVDGLEEIEEYDDSTAVLDYDDEPIAIPVKIKDLSFEELMEYEEIISSTFKGSSFNSVFTEITHDQKIDIDYPTQLHLYRLNARNGQFDMDALKSMLYRNVGSYVYSRAKIDNMTKAGYAGYVEGQAARILKRLSIQRIDFSDNALSEMLIYAFLEESLNAPKLMSRVEIDTELTHYKSESDGVHLLTIDDKAEPMYQFVFGTSKINNDFTSAIDDAFAKIINVEANKENEIHMVNNAVFDRFFDEAQINKLKDIILPAPGKTEIPDTAYGVFLGYSIDIPPSPDFSTKVNQKMDDDLKANIQHIIDIIKENHLENHSFYFYVLPFNNAEVDKKDIFEKIVEGDIDL
jgi:hypothetical protein